MSIRPLDLQVNVNSSIEVSKMQGELQARQANLQLDKDAKATAENLKKQEKVNQSDEASELSEDDSTINNKEKNAVAATGVVITSKVVFDRTQLVDLKLEILTLKITTMKS